MGKKNVLITGSNGMLGKDMVKLFVSKDLYNTYVINRTSKGQYGDREYICDLTDFEQTKRILKKIKPNIIINCAANINLDVCESNKEYTYKINAEVPALLASYQPQKTKYIHISTDSIFDGIEGNYHEDSATNPLNYYAYTKLEGERLSLRQNLNSIVIRTNIYGFNIPERNSLVEWALNSLRDNKEISGFEDVYFNPVYTKQLAEVTYKLIESDFKGLINVGCTQNLSKYEFLIKLGNQFNMSTNLISSIPVSVMNFKTERPKNTTLDIRKVQELINVNLDFDDGIKYLYQDYMNQ